MLQYSTIQAFTARFVQLMQLYHQRRKTAHKALQWIFRLFAVFCRCCSAGVSSYIVLPAPRWSVSQRRNTSSVYQIPPPRLTLCREAQLPIIIKYIRVQRCALLWPHARQRNTSQTMPARRGQLLPCADRWQVLHPTHLLRGQRLHLCRVSPAAFNLAPVSSQGAPSTRRGSPVAGARWAARNHWRLAAASLFGLSPDS